MKLPGLLAVGFLVLISMPARAQSLADRLTVRPREVATGTWSDRAGERRLFPDDSSRNEMVYVPQQCTTMVVRRQRCPLIVFIPANDDGLQLLRPVADRYGMILVSSSHIGSSQDRDAMLKQALQTFPIDPDKIAIMGTCGTGTDPLWIGGANLDVFSRLVVVSPGSIPVELATVVDPPHQTTEILVAAGLDESDGLFAGVQELRHKGHRVTHAIELQPHGLRGMYDYFGWWLQASWELPDTARPAPQVVLDPLPALTTDVLAKMTVFWTRFLQQPEAIQTTARQLHLREVVVPVGRERLVLVMTDMAALAARYPAVAADLKTAGLTAQQHEAYRVALASARATATLSGDAGTPEPNSVVAKNVAFIQAHPDEFAGLERIYNQEQLNMWTLP